jgi:hypothetical protein
MGSRPKLLEIGMLEDFWRFCYDLDEEDRQRLQVELAEVKIYETRFSSDHAIFQHHGDKSGAAREAYQEGLPILEDLADKKKTIQRKRRLLSISIKLTKQHLALLAEKGVKETYKELAKQVDWLRVERRDAKEKAIEFQKHEDSLGEGDKKRFFSELRAAHEWRAERVLTQSALTRVHMEELRDIIENVT